MILSMGRARPKFPYAPDDSATVSGRGWVVISFGVTAAFAALTFLPAETLLQQAFAASLFSGIPLVALAIVVGRGWTRLFLVPDRPHWLLIPVTAIATILTSAVAGLIIQAVAGVTPNPLSAQIPAMSVTAFLLRLGPTAPQLLGEELLTILPFLAIYWLLAGRFRCDERLAIWAALLGSTAIFAAAHLPTYHWQWAQCFGVIGTARVVLTLSYIWTRNLWVPIGAHILNDWTEFAFVFGVGHLPINSAADGIG